MLNFLIRPALTSDVTTILDLTIDGIGVWGSHINSNLKPWLDEISCPEYVESRINHPNHHIFMAELNGNVVGTVYLNTENEKVAHMGGLYCSLKKSGLGTTLLHYVIDKASEYGYKYMDCAIYENNIASISLMEKYGAIHTDTEVYGDVNYRTYQFDFTKESALIS